MPHDAKSQDPKTLEQFLAASPDDRPKVAAARAARRAAVLNSITCGCCGSTGKFQSETPPFAWHCIICGARGDQSNTPLASILPGEPPAAREVGQGGVDFLALTIYGDFDDGHKDLLERLDALQRKARHGDASTAVLPLGRLQGLVAAGGGGKGFSWTPYRVSVAGMTLRLSDRPDSSPAGDEGPPRPNVFVEIPSMVLMQRGERGALDDVHAVLAALGYTPTKITPSRVDICVDVVGVSMGTVAQAFTAGHVIRKTKKATCYFDGNTLETLMIGAPGADIQMRVYDKLRETEFDAPKREIMVERRWGGTTPTDAIRVEFQLRREALRSEFSVDTIEDLWDKLADLAAWACSTWIRFTEGDVSRTNTAKARVAGWWQQVRDAFSSWTGYARKRVEKRKKLLPDAKRLLLQAQGCLTSLFAVLGECKVEALDLSSKIFEFMHKQGSRVVEDIAAKRRLFESSTPDLQGLANV